MRREHGPEELHRGQGRAAGMNGTLRPATARYEIGPWSAALVHATGAPQSWPTTTARLVADAVDEPGDVARQRPSRVGARPARLVGAA